MMVLVTYDVSTVSNSGKKRLNKIAKICVDYGLRVQNSVFECNVDSTQWMVFRNKLLKTYNKNEDSLRFYNLGGKWERKVEHHGTKEVPNIEKDTLIV